MEYAVRRTSEDLRNRAEKKLREMNSAPWKPTCPEDAEQLLHEFQLFQIELEMQNEELRRSRTQWEKAFDALPDIITIQNQEMHIVRANKAAHKFFQARPGELDGKKCYELFTGAAGPCPGCPLLATHQDGAEHSAIIHHEKLGKIFQVFSHVIPARDGAMQYLLHNARDITEQKKIEENLFQSHKMEAMGTLAGGIAHDFNNILQAIMGFSDLARRDLPAAGRTGDYIDAIIKSGSRAADLVQQILTFSGKADQRRYSVQPYLIVNEALKLLRTTLPTTITLEEHIDPACGSILADMMSIHQVVVNLCANGCQAMENETGSLTVNLCRKEMRPEDSVGSDVSPGPFIELSVQDTGHGMDRKTMARIFEPYFTTKGMGKGHGLRLAVVHGIVKSLHGFIEVESEPGTGSTFHLYFPALAEADTVPVQTGTNEIAGGRE